MSPIILISLFIPLCGTVLGSAMVFFLKKEISPRMQKLLLGFASGVMIAASIWSLLQPAIDSYAENDYRSFLWPAIGFIVGVGFLLLLDNLIPHVHNDEQEEGIKKNKVSRINKMFFAVTIHNIPEGLALGVVIFSALTTGVSEQSVLVLAIGLAIQNFPEGAIVSMPLQKEGISKARAFLYGCMSGVVEPIADLIAIAFSYLIQVILPVTLAFAAGCMIYVVVEELIPESSRGQHSNLSVIGLTIGFVLMMILDIALG